MYKMKEEFLNMFTKPSIIQTGGGKQRIAYIDLAKGICILLVVFHHLCGEDLPTDSHLKGCLVSFRMPLYFILSGMFFKEYEGFVGFLKRKVNKLLIPFIAFYIISFLLSLSFFCDDSALKTIGYFFGGVFIEKTRFNVAIWFLWCLLLINITFYLIFHLCRNINKNKGLIIYLICWLLGIIGFTLGTYHINIPFWIDSSLTAMPFFATGYLIRKYTEILKPNMFDKYFFASIPLCFIFVYYFGRVTVFKTNYMSNSNILFTYTSGIIGTLGVLFTAKLLQWLPVISYYGRYSIMILCTHMLMYKVIVKPFIEPLYSNTGSIVNTHYYSTIIVLLSYAILIPIMKKYIPHITAQKDCIKV